MRALRSGWVSVVLNALTATLTAIYAGYYVALPDSNAQESLEAWHRINALGWKNTYGGVALFCLAAQAVQTHFAETRRQELARSRDERQASRLLQGIVGLLETAHPGINFRAFVTIVDRTGTQRITLLGAHINIDPELTAVVPADFGIAGDAFMSKSTKCGDVDDTNRDLMSDGTRVRGVWSEVRSVLAYPLLQPNSRHCFGTVNFDCDHPLITSGLGERPLQEMLQRVVAVIAELLQMRAAGLRA